MYECDLRILNGLPVTIEYTVTGPDPSVGIFGYGIDDYKITRINGRKCKKPPQWLYNRIDKANAEESIFEGLIADFEKGRDNDYYEDRY